MRPAHFHFLGRYDPFCFIKIELLPLSTTQFTRPDENKGRQTKRSSRGRLAVKAIDGAQQPFRGATTAGRAVSYLPRFSIFLKTANSSGGVTLATGRSPMSSKAKSSSHSGLLSSVCRGSSLTLHFVEKLVRNGERFNKSLGWSRLWPNKRDQSQSYQIVFADVLNVREHLRTLCGAQGRNRTTDTMIFSHVLYQLSYLGAGLARTGRTAKRGRYRGSNPHCPERPSEARA